MGLYTKLADNVTEVDVIIAGGAYRVGLPELAFMNVFNNMMS